jgi:hypothetical protein
MPERACLGWWPMTGWHFGLLIQAMVPLSGAALADETASDSQRIRLHRGDGE